MSVTNWTEERGSGRAGDREEGTDGNRGNERHGTVYETTLVKVYERTKYLQNLTKSVVKYLL